MTTFFTKRYKNNPKQGQISQKQGKTSQKQGKTRQNKAILTTFWLLKKDMPSSTPSKVSSPLRTEYLRTCFFLTYFATFSRNFDDFRCFLIFLLFWSLFQNCMKWSRKWSSRSILRILKVSNHSKWSFILVGDDCSSLRFIALFKNPEISTTP